MTQKCSNNNIESENNIKMNINKKRKKYVSISEKQTQFDKCKQYFANLSKEKQEEILQICFSKTMLEIYKTLPNIISILDKIIEKRASTIFPSSTIYGSPSSTYDEINKVIDLTERKNKILNLKVIAENLLNNLKPKHKEIATLKYVNKLTYEEIAIKKEVSLRSIYRNFETINKELLSYTKSKNWSSQFFKSQCKNEVWIEELLNKKLQSHLEIEIRKEH